MNMLMLPLRVITLVVFCLPLVILYILFPLAIEGNRIFQLTSFIFSFSVACVTYLPIASARKNSDTAQMAGVGFAGLVSLVLVLVSGIALYQVILGREKLALVFDAISIATLLILFFGNRFLFNFMDRLSVNNDFSSSHARWSRDLQMMALSCKDNQLKGQLYVLADRAMYQSRDVSSELSDINFKINSQMNSLTNYLATNDYQKANEICDVLSELLSQRELQLKFSRSRV